MIILQVNNVSKSFESTPILSNINLEVKSNEKIALVGKNGVGKSTLLKIIARELTSDSGQLIVPKHVTIGYLAQETGFESERTIWQEMIAIFAPLKKMEATLRELEVKMGDPDLLEQREKYEQVLATYDQLQNEFTEQGGYRYEADIRSVLHGLQFAEFDYEETIVSTLSGGQKTRLALAKLLLQNPDLLILDEPTNHLDIETLSWLETYLQNYAGSLLIVSHDRYFLDLIVTTVYELANGEATKYVGNYSNYLKERTKRYEQLMKEYEKQAADIANIEEFVQRNIARASTTKRAQSRRRQLEKMTRLEKPVLANETASFSFPIAKESGNNVLEIVDVSVTYEDEPVFTNVHLHMNKAERIAIVGPNGVGKSTLLKAIVQKVNYAGSIKHGANVTIAYYDQEQADLSGNKSVLNELWDHFPELEEQRIRSVLGSFLFSGDDVLKAVSALSGGEKARLALSRLMLAKANFLILDEPTNHLDLASRETLEEALTRYPGTVLFVSHDRYFINRIATKVAELSQSGVSEYIGNYDYYVEKKQELLELAQLTAEKEAPTENVPREKNEYEARKAERSNEQARQRRIQEIERTITEKEALVTEAELQLTDEAVYTNFEKVKDIQANLAQLQANIEDLLQEWESLHEEA